jgi:GGDEF domain-containing protein
MMDGIQLMSLKRSFFGAALYLALILILGQADYTSRPIINFASYFYLTVMLAVPVTLFFLSVSKVSLYVPLLVWAGIYMVILQVVDRTKSTTSIDFSIIVLEFILLEVGVWFTHQLAAQISYAESLMDTLALGTFPNRVRDIERESQRIKVELTRSRRYHRPLSLMVIDIEFKDADQSSAKLMETIQHDLAHRFTFARVGQIIDDLIRQTDLVLRDHKGCYVILCSETDFANAELLADRISQPIMDKAGLQMIWGIASFPDEALTFEDLLQKARDRLNRGKSSEYSPVLNHAMKDVSK